MRGKGEDGMSQGGGGRGEVRGGDLAGFSLKQGDLSLYYGNLPISMLSCFISTHSQHTNSNGLSVR